MLSLDVLDIGDAYRVVFRWADSTEFPDQGAIPGRYYDCPKHLYQSQTIPDSGDGVTMLLNQPIDLDCTMDEAFAD